MLAVVVFVMLLGGFGGARVVRHWLTCRRLAEEHTQREREEITHLEAATAYADYLTDPSRASLVRLIKVRSRGDGQGVGALPHWEDDSGRLAALAKIRDEETRIHQGAIQHARLRQLFHRAALRPWLPIPTDAPQP